jgi:spermidine/putrescine transport system permease protein
MSQNGFLNRFRGSEAASGLAMISPTAVYAVLMLAGPLTAVLLYSILTDGAGTVEWDFTLTNYAEVWSSPIYRSIMLRSLMVSFSVTLVTVIVAYPIAYFVSFHVAPSRKSIWLFLITIPFWTSYLIRVFLWKVILGYNGVFSSGLEGIGITDGPMSFMTNATGAMIVTLAHAYAPFAILPIFVALEKIDRSFLEAGQDLGETRLRTFWRVTLPLSMSGVIAAVLIVFIPTIGDYVTPDLIGSGKFPMIANVIEVQLLKLDNKALGSALAVSAMFIVAVVSVIFLLLNRRFLGAAK